MFHSQLLRVMLLLLACAGVRCDYNYFDYESPCNVETQAALEEIKSTLEDLKNDVVGLRQKIDPDFKLTPPETIDCPSGFTHLPSTGSCYMVVYERHNWTSAGEKCQKFGPGAHLVAITSAAEDRALKKFLTSDLSNNEGATACISTEWPHSGKLLWTSGQRQIENSCSTPFVWKLPSGKNQTYQFDNWQSGEPSCGKNVEFCMDMAANRNYAWNDIPCHVKICPLCEYNP